MGKIKEIIINVKDYEEALYRILNSNRLEDAKEHAAEALDVDVEEFLIEDDDTLDFFDEEYSDYILDDDVL